MTEELSFRMARKNQDCFVQFRFKFYPSMIISGKIKQDEKYRIRNITKNLNRNGLMKYRIKLFLKPLARFWFDLKKKLQSMKITLSAAIYQIYTYLNQ